jgi:hypothetical protein
MASGFEAGLPDPSRWGVPSAGRRLLSSSPRPLRVRLRTVAIVTTFVFIVAEIPGCPDFLRTFPAVQKLMEACSETTVSFQIPTR